MTERFSNIFRHEKVRGRKAALFCAIFACLLFLWPLPSPASASETDRVLESAESAFKAMKQRDYPAIWTNLSEKSRRTIAGDVHKAMRNEDRARYSLEVIKQDFDTGGPVSKEYWEAFLQNFNPDDVLEQSTWEIDYVKKETAEISILYKKSESPARLRMYKEDGRWKTGLVETFWGR